MWLLDLLWVIYWLFVAIDCVGLVHLLQSIVAIFIVEDRPIWRECVAWGVAMFVIECYHIYVAAYVLIYYNAIMYWKMIYLTDMTILY